MPFPLALAALSSMNGGGGLSGASQAPSGPITSGVGDVNVGGLDFGAKDNSMALYVVAGAAVVAALILSRRR
jgi:hypothetical protein